MKLAGMLEYWNIGFKIGIGLFFKFKLRCNPIKTNPFFHYSIIPLFQYDESARQSAGGGLIRLRRTWQKKTQK
jgi:hypothetical protein